MGYPQILNDLLLRSLLGLGLASAVSALAYWAGALSGDGALAATLVGTAVFAGGGLPAALLLLAFFFSSSAWSRCRAGRKRQVAEEMAKGSRRDAAQVLANGGVAAAIALVLLPLSPPQGRAWAAFAGSLAAATADTWGTELGLLAGVSPRLITTGRRVEAGTSGAITWQGSLAGAAGSFAMGALTLLLAGKAGSEWVVVIATAAAGVGGAALDSLLGATLQARYECSACGKRTEHHPRHRCGGTTILVGGQPWANNEVINFLCTAAGAMLGALFFVLWT
jgi:uncharacterized protein (TIGR00297 family)